MLDLYCGIGGFALAVAGAGVLAGARRRVTGVETSEAAVAGVRRTAADAGPDVRLTES